MGVRCSVNELGFILRTPVQGVDLAQERIEARYTRLGEDQEFDTSRRLKALQSACLGGVWVRGLSVLGNTSRPWATRGNARVLLLVLEIRRFCSHFHPGVSYISGHHDKLDHRLIPPLRTSLRTLQIPRPGTRKPDPRGIIT